MMSRTFKLVLGIKKDAVHSFGKTGHCENLGKIVDEDLAIQRGCARDLGFLCQFKKHARRLNLPCVFSDQAARGKKSLGSRMHVVLRSQDRVFGLVADNEELVAGFVGRLDKLGETWIGRHKVHSLTVNITLQCREIVLAAGTVEMVADAIFVTGDIRRNQTAFQRRRVEYTIVASDRVIEVDPNTHRSTAAG